MKYISSLLLTLILKASFSQPAKTDPYFVKSTDTISTHGPGCITRYIHEDKKGNIWLATWKGIMKYDGKEFTNYTLKENLIPFHVFSVFEDRSGNLWFGTVRGGAYKFDGKKFRLYTTEDGLINDLIGGMMEDKNGDLWFATDGGISRLDTSASNKISTKMSTTPWGLPLTSKKGFTNYTTDNGLAGNRVNSFLQDKSGMIWIATRTGVSRYDGKSFSIFTNNGVPFRNTWSIRQDRNGKILIGGEDGLYSYDPSLWGENAFTKLLPNFICNIYEDRSGNLWISAGEDKGMSLYKYDQKGFTRIITKSKDGDSQVFEITEDKNGNIWFGTMQGPCRYDGKDISTF